MINYISCVLQDRKISGQIKFDVANFTVTDNTGTGSQSYTLDVSMSCVNLSRPPQTSTC